MSKKSSKKLTPEEKKMIAFITKQIYKSPKKLDKRAVKRQYEEEKKQERRELVQKATPVNASFHLDDYDIGMEDNPYQCTPSREIWERYTIEELVDLYVASLDKGKPDLALKNPQQERHICQCTDKRTKSITLYMMCD
ncbi:hypothetical protein HPULCUR_001717 [Helicostylum pulchrum]|uniref:Uncharacterized protein n=1 Tax=Helicostylum pulchrum TaxID=562976 RepID=A0ABP9XNI2_9FUNG